MYEGRIHAKGMPMNAGPVTFPHDPASVTSATNASRDGIDAIGAVLRGIHLVLISLAVGVVAALAFLVLAPPRYAASTTLIIDPTDLRIVDKGLREQSSFSDAQIAQVENEVRVITSTGVLGALVDAQHLDQDPEFAGGGPSMLHSLAAAVGLAAPGAASDARLDAIRVLSKDVVVKREERTYVVQIVVTTQDSAKSVRLADALVSAFLAGSADQHLDASRRVAMSLKDRLNELRQSVQSADQKLVDYKQHHGIVAAVGRSVTEQQLAEASTTLVQARRRVEDLRSRVNQVRQADRTGNGGAIPDALQSTTITALRSQLAQVVRRRGDLQATLGPRHPDVIQVQSEERGLRGLLKEEIGRIASVAQSDLIRAVEDQTAAQTAFDKLKASVTNNSQLSVPLRELEREVEAARTVYEAFLVRTREIAEQEQIDPANIRVISTAQKVEGRTWPPRPPLVLGGGAFVGLLIGLGLALLRERLAAHRSWIFPTSSGVPQDIRYAP